MDRAEDIALFRYGLVRPAADPSCPKPSAAPSCAPL